MAEVLLLTLLTLAGVRAAKMTLTIAKVGLIIEDTARLKPKWQNNVNVFLATQSCGRAKQNAFCDLF